MNTFSELLMVQNVIFWKQVKRALLAEQTGKKEYALHDHNHKSTLKLIIWGKSY
jgi:hypothetical protein